MSEEDPTPSGVGHPVTTTSFLDVLAHASVWKVMLLEAVLPEGRLTFLHKKTVRTLRSTCKALKAAADEAVHELSMQSEVFLDTSPHSLASRLAKFPNTRTLKYNVATPGSLAVPSMLRASEKANLQLDALELSSSTQKCLDLAPVLPLIRCCQPGLQTLAVRHLRLCDASIWALAELPRLISLRMDGVELADGPRNLHLLSELTQLTSLTWRYNPRFLEDTPEEELEGADVLELPESLKHVDLGCLPITDQLMLILAELPQLEQLTLGASSLEAGLLTEEGVEAWPPSAFPALRKLTCECFEDLIVHDTGEAPWALAFERLTALKDIDLRISSYCSCLGDAIRQVTQLSGLTRLAVKEMEGTVIDLDFLTDVSLALPSLRELLLDADATLPPDSGPPLMAGFALLAHRLTDLRLLSAIGLNPGISPTAVISMFLHAPSLRKLVLHSRGGEEEEDAVAVLKEYAATRPPPLPPLCVEITIVPAWE